MDFQYSKMENIKDLGENFPYEPFTIAKTSKYNLFLTRQLYEYRLREYEEFYVELPNNEKENIIKEIYDDIIDKTEDKMYIYNKLKENIDKITFTNFNSASMYVNPLCYDERKDSFIFTKLYYFNDYKIWQEMGIKDKVDYMFDNFGGIVLTVSKISVNMSSSIRKAFNTKTLTGKEIIKWCNFNLNTKDSKIITDKYINSNEPIKVNKMYIISDNDDTITLTESGYTLRSK